MWFTDLRISGMNETNGPNIHLKLEFWLCFHCPWIFLVLQLVGFFCFQNMSVFEYVCIFFAYSYFVKARWRKLSFGTNFQQWGTTVVPVLVAAFKMDNQIMHI